MSLLHGLLDVFVEQGLRREGEKPPDKIGSNALLQFCRRRSVPRWQEGPHHPLICDVIQRAFVGAMQGQGIKVLLMAPPRHGKTHIASVMGPAWGIGTFPDCQVILTAYGQKLATNKSAAARDIVQRVGMREWGVTVDQGSKAKNDWKIAGRRGRLLGSGVRGPITGEGANVGIIDDPVKSWKEAHSPVYREEVINWYRATFATRIEPGGSTILMLTRWHELDLAGYLLEEEGRVEDGGQWVVIRLPAFSEGKESDPLGREHGEPLWPQRWSRDALLERKKTLGSYAWAALFQQSPQPEGGSFIKRHHFRYAKRAIREVTEQETPESKAVRRQIKGFELTLQTPEGPVKEWVVQSQCWVLVSGDLALSLEQSADFCALGIWFITPPVRGIRRRILVFVVHEHIAQPDQVPRLKRIWEDFRPKLIAIEKGTADLATIQHAIRAGLPIRAVPLDGDKLARGLPLQSAYENEQVFHLIGGDWLATYEAEVVAFPNGKKDDQFDMASCMENTVRDIELSPTPGVYRREPNR